MRVQILNNYTSTYSSFSTLIRIPFLKHYTCKQRAAVYVREVLTSSRKTISFVLPKTSKTQLSSIHSLDGERTFSKMTLLVDYPTSFPAWMLRVRSLIISNVEHGYFLDGVPSRILIPYDWLSVQIRAGIFRHPVPLRKQ